MTDRSVIHDTFTIERSYRAAPSRVFAAFASAEAKNIWGDTGDLEPADGEADCRGSGHEEAGPEPSCVHHQPSSSPSPARGAVSLAWTRGVFRSPTAPENDVRAAGGRPFSGRPDPAGEGSTSYEHMFVMLPTRQRRRGRHTPTVGSSQRC